VVKPVLGKERRFLSRGHVASLNGFQGPPTRIGMAPWLVCGANVRERVLRENFVQQANGFAFSRAVSPLN
jgi:hypothetical protein